MKNTNCTSTKFLAIKKIKKSKPNVSINNNNHNIFFRPQLNKPKKINNILIYKISNSITNSNQQKSHLHLHPGKTAKISPIAIHNKLVGYMNLNKVNSSIPIIVKRSKNNFTKNNDNKNLTNSKSTSKSVSLSKSLSRSKSKSSSSKKENFSNFSREKMKNISKKLNFVKAICHIHRGDAYRMKKSKLSNNKNKEKNSLCSNIKYKNIKILTKTTIKTKNNLMNPKYKRETFLNINLNIKKSRNDKNKFQRLTNNNKHFNNNIKLINNITNKKIQNKIKSKTTVHSMRNSIEKNKSRNSNNSRNKSKSKKSNSNSKVNKETEYKNNNILNNKNNLNCIKNQRKYNIVNNFLIRKKSSEKGEKEKTYCTEIIRKILISNETNNLRSLINKYPIVTQGNFHRDNNKKPIYNNTNSKNNIDTIHSSSQINKKYAYYDSTNRLSRSLGNTMKKIKSAQNSKMIIKPEKKIYYRKNNKKRNNLKVKYYDSINNGTNGNKKLFPITTVQTKYNINNKRNLRNRNKITSKNYKSMNNSISKTQKNMNNTYLKYNLNFETDNNKSKSKSKSKSKNKSCKNSVNKKNNIDNLSNYHKNKKLINTKYYVIRDNKKKVEKKNIVNKNININIINKINNKKNDVNKRNICKIKHKNPYPKNQYYNNINNNINIFNIIESKNNNQENVNSVIRKINGHINLTSSILQSYSKENYPNYDLECNNNNFILNDGEYLSKNPNATFIKKPDNYNTLLSQKENYNNFKLESIKLSQKIKNYGITHKFLEYPKTTLEFYKIGRSIGHGAFGKVNLALHVLSGHLVCLKSFNKNKHTFPLNKVMNEVQIMSKFRRHKNIVKLFEVFETNNYYCIVMENVIGGNLLNAINKITKIPEYLSKIIFKQLIETLQYIHFLGIVHRDIKPDNILLELNNTIKICDFGISKEIKKGQLLKDSCGTPAFVAPEILLDEPYDPFPTDIWSCGVVLYAMITGFFPFRGINEAELHKSILNGVFVRTKDISNDLYDLLKKILEINPRNRISLEDILKHPWLADVPSSSEINNLKLKENLFTKAEKIIYGKLRLDYRVANNNIQLENFTNKNIDSYYEELNQNIQTISYVFTPYNTPREKDEDEDLFYDDVNIEDNIIKYLPKANEMSRLYEIQNNCDIDQGYLVSKKQTLKKQLNRSMNKSYEKKINNENIEDEKYKNVSSLTQAKYYLNKGNNNVNYNDLLIDENAVKFVENFGYKREYIINSIENNELNHVSASYYLRLSLDGN